MNGVAAKVDAKITGVNVGRMAFYVTVIVTIAYLALTKVEWNMFQNKVVSIDTYLFIYLFTYFTYMNYITLFISIA